MDQQEPPSSSNDQLLPDNYAFKRLNEEIDFYSKNQAKCRFWHRFISSAELICAALIPMAIGLNRSSGQYFASILAAAVVILSGVRRVYQFHETWLRHKSTWIALEGEKSLFLANARQYRELEQPAAIALLAERTHELVSAEVGTFIGQERGRAEKPTTNKDT